MKYFLAVGLCCALVSGVLSRNLVKRNNAYGDEPVKPEGAAAAVEAGPSPSAPAADAPAASAPAPEQSSAAVAQPAPESTASKASGYRKKRNNQYGDEPVKTPDAASMAAPPPPAPEMTPAAQPPPAPAAGGAEVQKSGY